MNTRETERSVAQIIEDAARDAGVDPNDPYFRAKLMKALIACGYFKPERRAQ